MCSSRYSVPDFFSGVNSGLNEKYVICCISFVVCHLCDWCHTVGGRIRINLGRWWSMGLLLGSELSGTVFGVGSGPIGLIEPWRFKRDIRSFTFTAFSVIKKWIPKVQVQSIDPRFARSSYLPLADFTLMR